MNDKEKAQIREELDKFLWEEQCIQTIDPGKAVSWDILNITLSATLDKAIDLTEELFLKKLAKTTNDYDDLLDKYKKKCDEIFTKRIQNDGKFLREADKRIRAHERKKVAEQIFKSTPCAKTLQAISLCPCKLCVEDRTKYGVGSEPATHVDSGSDTSTTGGDR